MNADDRLQESNSLLVEQIRAMIQHEGRITFARFMQAALYYPDLGYYLSPKPRPGRAGDFLTAPEAHPIFGQTIARQIEEIWERLGQPQPFQLREYGAGNGSLALGILSGLTGNPTLLEAVRYEPVEINPSRRQELTERLTSAGFARNLREPVPEQPFTGCVLANEFLDAFPVHRVTIQDGVLLESYVIWDDGWFAEELGPPSTPELVRYLEAGGIVLAEGQRAEINLAAPIWLAQTAPALRRGNILLIDYGYPARQLYGADRHQGTLKAYYQHGVHEDPFRAVGRQDLTAHVDFSALEDIARAAGLDIHGLTTQADFLAGAGIGEILVEMQQQPETTVEDYLAARASVMRMIDPGAMGRFRVLVLGRDVPSQPTLSGLRPSF